jgi:hypothetical protein
MIKKLGCLGHFFCSVKDYGNPEDIRFPRFIFNNKNNRYFVCFKVWLSREVKENYLDLLDIFTLWCKKLLSSILFSCFLDIFLLRLYLFSFFFCTLNSDRRKNRLVEYNAKCRYLQKWPVKGLSGRCFICLSPSLLLPHTPPPPYALYTCIQ